MKLTTHSAFFDNLLGHPSRMRKKEVSHFEYRVE
jgi:hypothetical protein